MDKKISAYHLPPPPSLSEPRSAAARRLFSVCFVHRDTRPTRRCSPGNHVRFLAAHAERSWLDRAPYLCTPRTRGRRFHRGMVVMTAECSSFWNLSAGWLADRLTFCLAVVDAWSLLSFAAFGGGHGGPWCPRSDSVNLSRLHGTGRDGGAVMISNPLLQTFAGFDSCLGSVTGSPRVGCHL